MTYYQARVMIALICFLAAMFLSLIWAPAYIEANRCTTTIPKSDYSRVEVE
jgi:hypothetical protein